QQVASEKNRIQKILEDANIKLSSVVSNMSGATATKIIDAMISGEEDIDKLIKFRHGKMQASKEKLAGSMKGAMTDHHRFMLRTIKDSIVEKEKTVKKLQDQILIHVEANEHTLDAELLSTIPGVGKEAAHEIIAELGTD